jgi:hypothetical protein
MSHRRAIEEQLDERWTRLGWNPFFFSAKIFTFSTSYMEISARLYQHLR